MKIIRYYPRAWKGDGGITRSVRYISEGLARAGAEVTVAVEQGEPPARDGAFRWLAVKHSAGPDGFRRPVGLAEHLRGADLLVLHSAWVYHNVYAASMARRLGVPYVLEPRGAYDPCILRRRRALKKAWWWTLERRAVRNASAVHVFFDSEEEHLRSMGYEGPVIVAPNGIAPPEEVAWDGGSGGYLLWIGRFDPEHKGLDLLLHAVRLLPAGERPTLRLHGPDWAGGKVRTAALVKELELQDVVSIGPPVYGEEKWGLISRAAAFVYPSRWEGFGNAAAEAVAVGVPTLVTPYPFGRWLAARGAATMAEPGPAGLAEGVREVLRPEARDAGRVGMRLLREELTWDAVARAWLRQAEAVL